MAHKNLRKAQVRMKGLYDKSSCKRTFNPGDKVLVLVPNLNNALSLRYCGPFTVHSKLSDLNYVVNTPDRRKKQTVYHVNSLKKYYDNCNNFQSTAKITLPVCSNVSDDVIHDKLKPPKLVNSSFLDNLNVHLMHLSTEESHRLSQLFETFPSIFGDVPKEAKVPPHDVDVGDAKSIKQHPYRVNPEKAALIKDEIDYMLKNDIIEPSFSNWSSPCLLVPKDGGSFRFVTDFRKVNALTKADSYPLPRIEDVIDKVGQAKIISKIDLLSGYWQMPLSDRAKEISAFVTPNGFYRYKRMPFGM
jgi:hypothetical protein